MQAIVKQSTEQFNADLQADYAELAFLMQKYQQGAPLRQVDIERLQKALEEPGFWDYAAQVGGAALGGFAGGFGGAGGAAAGKWIAG